MSNVDTLRLVVIWKVFWMLGMLGYYEREETRAQNEHRQCSESLAGWHPNRRYCSDRLVFACLLSDISPFSQGQNYVWSAREWGVTSRNNTQINSVLHGISGGSLRNPSNTLYDAPISLWTESNSVGSPWPLDCRISPPRGSRQVN